MAWTSFTTALVAGDVLRLAQRNELYDALEERLQAAGNSGDGLHADMSQITGGDIATDLVKYTWLGTLRTERFGAVLNRICVRFARTNASPAFFTATNLRTDIATVLSSTEANIATAWTSAIASALSFNALREGLRLLAYPVLTIVADDLVRRDGHSGDPLGDPDPGDWASAKTDFFAATEDVGTRIAQISARHHDPIEFPWEIIGQRSTADYSIPAVPPFENGWTGWRFFNVFRVGSAFVSMEVRAILSGIGETTFQADTESSTLKGVVYPSGSDVGDLQFEFRPTAYDTGAELDDFDPTSTDRGTGMNRGIIVLTQFAGLYTAPTFTHP